MDLVDVDLPRIDALCCLRYDTACKVAIKFKTMVDRAVRYNDLVSSGQFTHLYPYIVCLAADGRLHFVGETRNAHQAWVIGALSSAQSAIMLSLVRFERWDLAKVGTL